MLMDAKGTLMAPFLKSLFIYTHLNQFLKSFYKLLFSILQIAQSFNIQYLSLLTVRMHTCGHIYHYNPLLIINVQAGFIRLRDTAMMCD